MVKQIENSGDERIDLLSLIKVFLMYKKDAREDIRSYISSRSTTDMSPEA